MIDMQATIATRRDGGVHTREELAELAVAAAKGAVPDYQLSAWLMAAFLRPLTLEETAYLTEALAHSGEVMSLEGLPRPWVDKHSTGGVGDKTTLALLPILAACGLTVVKMSGRGLGVTGGTIDKLAAVSGFRTNLSPDEMKDQAKRIGLALTGQSPDLAPADKVLYALRDATTTVGSVPLIVSSVLSKKMAGGAETIVLDVKCGKGALVKSAEEAKSLASMLSEVGKRLNLNVRIAMTDMSQPLGSACGNALEVREAIRVLDGSDLNAQEARFRELCVKLAGLTLAAAGLCPSIEQGEQRAEAAITDGTAFGKMRDWFSAQGADLNVLDDPDTHLPKARLVEVVPASAGGYIAEVDADLVGRGVLRLGGGRKRKEDSIDPAVGIQMNVHVGSRIEEGQPLFTIHALDPDSLEKVRERTLPAIRIVQQRVEPKPLLIDIV